MYLAKSDTDKVELSKKIEGRFWEEFGDKIDLYLRKLDIILEVVLLSSNLKFITQRFLDTDWDIQLLEYCYNSLDNME